MRYDHTNLLLGILRKWGENYSVHVAAHDSHNRAAGRWPGCKCAKCDRYGLHAQRDSYTTTGE